MLHASADPFGEELIVGLDVQRFYHVAGIALDTDIRAGFTTVGPHRDDFTLNIGGRAAAEFASEGQQVRGIVVGGIVAALAALDYDELAGAFMHGVAQFGKT